MAHTLSGSLQRLIFSNPKILQHVISNSRPQSFFTAIKLISPLHRKSLAFTKVPVRFGGTGTKTFSMTNSKIEWRRTIDGILFHFTAAAIPTALLITYVNIFIGEAELADIPEGYEPKPWEYHKHPIARFITRYIHKSEEDLYERNLSVIRYHFDRDRRTTLQKRVKKFMAERQDYKGWYWIPEPGGLEYSQYKLEEVEAMHTYPYDKEVSDRVQQKR